MIISSSLPIFLPYISWHFVIFWKGYLRRTSANSFGGLTLGSWHWILCWTWLLSAIALGWDADSFTTWLLSAITIGWKEKLVKNGHVITKIVHSSDDEIFYLKQRNGRDYEAIQIDINDVYLIKRYYRQNKSIPLLG